MTKKKSQEGITVRKEENFSEWYTQLIKKADLADYSDVSGCMVFKPTSYVIWEKIKQEVDKRLKIMGVKNAYFPLFIPESLLKKEETHVKGFAPEVAWVTQAGNTKLKEKLAVRPTSEAIMYDFYSKWIRSWRDLPLKLNQWNNVVRWEFAHPVPFLRTREFLWNEGHTVFASKEEAEAEMPKIINMYKEILKNYLALPGLVGKKTEKEKFAGAEYTITIEHYMPNGRAIQGPDFHHDGQNFAKAYNIKFLNEDEKEEYAWQNTWAITTRELGVMFAVHSDDKGLVLPPKLAENKIVIIPIFFEDSKEKVLKKAEEIAKSLKEYNAILDKNEEYTPGWKFHEYELKGIPLRIEIGPKDLEKEQVIAVRRDNGEKKAIKIKEINKEILKILDEMHESLYKRAEKMLHENIKEVDNFEDFKKAIKNKKIARAYYCGNVGCEDWIKTEGAKALNMPLDQPSMKGKKCIYCKKDAKFLVHWGKSY